MIQCQNCGRVNNYGSNFCRFCGTKFQVNQVFNQNNTEPPAAPRPYSWKTDEFQIAEAPPQRPRQKTINPVQPLQYPATQYAPRPMMQQPAQFNAPFAYQNPQQAVAYGNNCPRCASQSIRYEKKISQTGWIVFAVLLVTFFPLFWIGLLIKEDVKVCQVCNFKM